MQLEQTHAHFQTTEWPLVQASRDVNDPRHVEARNVLIRRYWPPVYAWLRRSGKSREAAAELAQAFFVDVVVARALFERPDPKIGRLRNYLLTALRNFLVDNRRASSSSPSFIPLDAIEQEEQELALRERYAASPDHVYEELWASGILVEALRRTEQLYRLNGRLDYWAVFEARIVQPARSGNTPRSLGQLAAEHGFTDAGHVAVAVHLVRRRCLDVLEQVIAETAFTPDDRQDELARIRTLLL
jgi:RNA polymerase sigma-70 factor (ECF subfamily)